MLKSSWRHFAIATLLAIPCLAPIARPDASSQPFGFDTVRKMASTLAQQPYQAPDETLPPALASLDYIGYSAIRYRHDKGLWIEPGPPGQFADELAFFPFFFGMEPIPRRTPRAIPAAKAGLGSPTFPDENPEAGLWRPTSYKYPFHLEFFHRGYIYRPPVDIYVIEDGAIKPVRFDPGLFQYAYGRPEGIQAVKDLGFAGFRAAYPLNRPGDFSEVISFLGASYFRAVSQNGAYGASARGLAVNMAAPDRPEEFPAFRKFWIQRPEHNDRSLTIYALLDSPSATGAYRFQVVPGRQTLVDVESSVFLRQPVRKLGIAPMSSMFFYGKGQTFGPALRDYRPEVHDSDGLLVASADGIWQWRPLQNPRTPQISIFRTENLAGFGLLQRDRNPYDYQDDCTNMERRPSIWVEPLGSWGPGQVELLELSANYEGLDNIAAQFVPDHLAQPGTEMKLNYRLHFYSYPWPLHDDLHVTATDSQLLPSGRMAYDVWFAGTMPRGADVKPIVAANGGTIHDLSLTQLSPAGPWHLHFEVAPNNSHPSTPLELRAFLHAGPNTVSETWCNAWKP